MNEIFNLRSVEKFADLNFTCEGCGKQYQAATASCCAGKMFRVARIVFRDPYRHTSDMDDGYKVNNPGTAGEIGESGLGTTHFRNDEPGFDEEMQNDYLPKDGSPFDDFGTGENSSSDNFLEDGPTGSSDALGAASGEAPSPFSKVDNPEPFHAGPHNMQKGLGSLKREGDLFERIRKRRKGL